MSNLIWHTFQPLAVTATREGIVVAGGTFRYVFSKRNGLITSIILETIILSRQLGWLNGLRTALGMSLVSMISMEIAMNATDWLLVGSLKLTWWSIVPSLAAGFLTPWPYNYWRLKKFGVACH